MNIRSLSFRLVIWYAGVLTAVFIVLGALRRFLRHYLEATVLDTHSARPSDRRTRSPRDDPSQTGALAMARQVEDLYSPEANDRFIRVIRSDGHVVYASQATRTMEASCRPRFHWPH